MPNVSRPEPSFYFKAENEGSGLLPWQHVSEEMLAARNYWLATAAADGRPHAMPVWGLWHDPHFVFSTSPKSKKARNLGAQPWAVVHLESGSRVVVVEGDVRRVNEAPELQSFVDGYNEKYSWNFDIDEIAHHAVFSLRARKVFAWLGSEAESFGGTATRWIFD